MFVGTCSLPPSIPEGRRQGDVTLRYKHFRGLGQVTQHPGFRVIFLFDYRDGSTVDNDDIDDDTCSYVHINK